MTILPAPLPASPDLDHLKKQAKQLLRAAREGELSALQRFVAALPAARGLAPADLVHRELRLHDAQSVLAREFGFKSWTDLSHFVAWKRSDRAERLRSLARWICTGSLRERRIALRMLSEEPDLFAGEAWLACALGDISALKGLLEREGAVAADAAARDWINRPIGPLQMPPLVAVSHSQLIREPDFAAGLLASAALLLQHGADPDAAWTNPEFPDSPLSALYGAAGRNHSPAMTRLLLEAGATPNDNESLYHSCESPDPACTRLLLAAGARVAGTNALGRILDFDKPELLKLLLDHNRDQGGDAAERSWIHHAILRGRGTEHIRILAEAGGDLRAVDHDGISLFRFAQLHGRTDVLEILREAGIEEALTAEEQFIAACARGDESAARAILAGIPDLFSRLTPTQLETMPQLAAVGQLPAVRTMLELGWPREIKTGWGATALNQAVFRGDSQMAALLLDFGADWRTEHDFKDNVLGTLSWASTQEVPQIAEPVDYVDCARVLLAHGVPFPAFENYPFSAEVDHFLDSARLSRPSFSADPAPE